MPSKFPSPTAFEATRCQRSRQPRCFSLVPGTEWLDRRTLLSVGGSLTGTAEVMASATHLNDPKEADRVASDPPSDLDLDASKPATPAAEAIQPTSQLSADAIDSLIGTTGETESASTDRPSRFRFPVLVRDDL